MNTHTSITAALEFVINDYEEKSFNEDLELVLSELDKELKPSKTRFLDELYHMFMANKD